MIDLERQNGLFSIIGDKLKEKLECYVVGRIAMMYYNMKGNTKDIDLVFDNDMDRERVEKVLRRDGFKEKDVRVIYFGKRNTPVMLERGDERFDLFIKKVVTFEITDTIKERISAVNEFGNFIVKVISPEDIILLKCATERAGDRVDAVEIMKKKNINWDVIIEESVNQTKLESYLFPIFLYDFLEELKEDFKADVPKKVLDEVRKISEKMLVEYMKKKRKK